MRRAVLLFSFFVSTANAQAPQSSSYKMRMGSGISTPSNMLTALQNPGMTAVTPGIKVGAVGSSFLSGGGSATGIGAVAKVAKSILGANAGGIYSVGGETVHLAFADAGTYLDVIGLGVGVSAAMRFGPLMRETLLNAGLTWNPRGTFGFSVMGVDFYPDPNLVGGGVFFQFNPKMRLFIDGATNIRGSSVVLKPGAGFQMNQVGATLSVGFGVGQDKGKDASQLVRKSVSIGLSYTLPAKTHIEIYFDHVDSGYVTLLGSFQI